MYVFSWTDFSNKIIPICRCHLLLFITIVLIGCDRKSEEISQVNIHVPQKGSLNTNWPPLNELCWGANITGEGINNFNPASCALDWGLVGGLVESGKAIELSVPRGPKRNIEVFVWKKTATETCKSYSLLTAKNLVKVYKVGEVNNFDIVKSVETINVDVSFPSDNLSWLAKYNAEAACWAANDPTPDNESKKSLRVSYGIGSDEGTQYKIKIRMTHGHDTGGEP